jgi:hypothetical protein
VVKETPVSRMEVLGFTGHTQMRVKGRYLRLILVRYYLVLINNIFQMRYWQTHDFPVGNGRKCRKW